MKKLALSQLISYRKSFLKTYILSSLSSKVVRESEESIKQNNGIYKKIKEMGDEEKKRNLEIFLLDSSNTVWVSFSLTICSSRYQCSNS